MPQFNVLAYVLEVSTAPRQRQAGVAPPEMVPAVTIQVQGVNQAIVLPIETTTEFMAICALIQAPGRLVFESDQQRLQKIFP